MPGRLALEPVTDVAARGRPPEGACGALSATQTSPLFAWAVLGHSAARPFLPALTGAPWERAADTAFRTCRPGRQAPRAQTDRPRTSPGSPPSHRDHVLGAQHVPRNPRTHAQTLTSPSSHHLYLFWGISSLWCPSQGGRRCFGLGKVTQLAGIVVDCKILGSFIPSLHPTTANWRLACLLK